MGVRHIIAASAAVTMLLVVPGGAFGAGAPERVGVGAATTVDDPPDVEFPSDPAELPVPVEASILEKEQAGLVVGTVAGSIAVVRTGAATAAGPLSEARAAAVRLDGLLQNNPGAQQLAPNAVRLADGAVLSFPMAGDAEDKCSYEDVCLFEHANFGGERLRFTTCAVYELRHYQLSDGRLWSTQVSSVINRLPAGSWAHIWHKGGALPAEVGMAKWELLHSSRATAVDQPAQQFPSVGWNDRAEVVKPARIPTSQCL